MVDRSRVRNGSDFLKIGDTREISEALLDLEELWGRLSDLAETTTAHNVGGAVQAVGLAINRLNDYFEWVELHKKKEVVNTFENTEPW